MISRLFFIFFVSLNLSTTALAESYAVKVLNSKVEDYERALVSCKKSENERGLPDKGILENLKRYKDQELIGAVLNSEETSDESKEEARYISGLIHEISWSNYKINNELSNNIKSDIGESDYFKSPFNPFLILEELNIL